MKHIGVLFLFSFLILTGINAQFLFIDNVYTDNTKDGRIVYKNAKTKSPINGSWRVETTDKRVYECDFVNGMFNGLCKTYILGNLTEIAYYKEGIRDGEIIGYYGNGTSKKYLRNYNNGVLNGKFTDYYHDGTIKHNSNYTAGKITGVTEDFYPDGKLNCKRHYVDGQRDGESIAYYPDGELKFRCFYKNGKLDGKQEYFGCDNDQNHPAEKGDYHTIAIYDTGKLIEINSVYDNGQIRQKTDYNNLEGDVYTYDNQGNPTQIETYENEKLIKKISFLNDGQKKQFDYHDDGTYSRSYYNKNGILYEKTTYLSYDTYTVVRYKDGKPYSEMKCKKGKKGRVKLL